MKLSRKYFFIILLFYLLYLIIKHYIHYYIILYYIILYYIILYYIIFIIHENYIIKIKALALAEGNREKAIDAITLFIGKRE